MKNFIFNFIVIGSVLIAISGCSKSSTESGFPTENNSSKVVTETKLFRTPTASINEKNTVILSLENPLTTETKNDISDVGSDCFVFTPTEDLNKTLLDIDSDIAVSHVSVEDLQSNEIKEAYKNSEKIYVDFHKDREYKYCVYHDDSTQVNQTLFVFFNKTAPSGLLEDQESVNNLIINKECTGLSCDLDNADLTGMNLSDVNLSGAKMHNVILADVNMTNADLTNTLISGVNLKDATLDNVIITDPYFSYINVSGASFKGTKFPENYRFDKDSINLSYQGVDFTDADLSGAIMIGVNFEGAIFKDANLSGADIYATNFTNANLQGADLSDITHISSDTDFTNAILEDIDLDSIKMISRAKANLTGAKFTLFTWIPKYLVGNTYAYCSAVPYEDNSDSELYFCSYGEYGDLGMLFLTDDEYNKQKPKSHSKTCFDVTIVASNGSSWHSHKKGHLCFSNSVGISVDWNNYMNKPPLNTFNQMFYVSYYCVVDFYSATCKTPEPFSFSFK